MSDFKAKMHQIRFPLVRGPTSKATGGRERGREGEGKGEEGCPPVGESGSASAASTTQNDTSEGKEHV